MSLILEPHVAEAEIARLRAGCPETMPCERLTRMGQAHAEAKAETRELAGLLTRRTREGGEVMDWQDMSTAPREGEAVLLWGTPDGWGNPWYVVATWRGDGWRDDLNDNPVHNPTRWCPIPANPAPEEPAA